ncbi:MAG TPA: hypothetical protein VM345_04315 [Acidimicrobiales bacterium]|nr:hypothetical protein [Acidimicrobiales bacterium]
MAVLVCGAASAAGCGGGNRDSEAEAVSPEPVEYGTAIEAHDETSPSAATGEPGPSEPAHPAHVAAEPPTPENRAPARPANRTEIDRPEGVRLVLVAEGTTRYRTDHRIRFQLEYENVSGATLYQNPDQSLRFVLWQPGAEPRPAWSNTSCRLSLGGLDEDRPPSGVIELAPGERASFIDEYPTKSTSDHAVGPSWRECVVAPGEYFLVGYLELCGTLERSAYNDQPYCGRSAVKQLASRPLKLTFSG